MSEYQYYEFRTVGRRLTDKEMHALRSVSSRADITPTSFTNEYSFGDFKGNPNAWMEKYFDGFVYLANWGTRELQLALPATLLARGTVRQYCCGHAASVREKSGKLILKFLLEEESSGDWIEGGGEYLVSLLQIRNELIQGDFRSLYLGWLLGALSGELENEEREPTVPPNLGNLSAAQECFAEFFQLDPDLLAVAAKNSPETESEPADQTEFSSWIASLQAADKDEMLVRVAAGGEAQVCMELQSRFHRLRTANQFKVTVEPRSVGTLLAAAEMHKEGRQQKKRRIAALAKEQRNRESAIAHRKHLDSLVGQSEEIWTTVETLIATRQPKSYDLAVQQLVDLRDLAAGANDQRDFERRLGILGILHSSKKTFIERLEKAGLQEGRERLEETRDPKLPLWP